MRKAIIEQVTVSEKENFTPKTIETNKAYGETLLINGEFWIVTKELQKGDSK